MMYSISLICLDLDGTIMTYDEPPGCFHREIVELLNDIGTRDVRWCTNSGRDMESQVEILNRSTARGLLHLPSAVMSSECFIFHYRNGTYLADESWNTSARQRLTNFHEKVHNVLAPELDDLRDRYVLEKTYWTDEGTAFLVASNDELVPSRFRDEIVGFMGRVKGSMVTQNGGWIAVLPVELGKGNVLAAYARSQGLSRESVLAIGDHNNDLTMLDGTHAAHVGCPADAAPEIVQAVNRAGGHVASADGPLGTVEVIKHFMESRNGPCESPSG